MRTRSTDYTVPATWGPHLGKARQVMRVVVNGQWTLVYRDAVDQSNTSTANTWSRGLESITDVIGSRETFNPCTHTRAPLVSALSFPPCRTPVLSPGIYQLTPYEWYTIEAVKEAYAIGGWSLRAHTTQTAAACMPSLPSVDWVSLVTAVGGQLEGAISSSNNILVEIAQLSQTVSMFKNPFSVKSLRFFRKSSLTLSQLARSSSNAWLEYQYGWRNLAISVTALAKSFERIRAHRAYLQSTANQYAPISASASSKMVYTPTQIGSPQYNVRLYTDRVETTARFSANVLRKTPITQVRDFDLLMQEIGANKITEALWDLVPFSFVVDWFVNVKDWMNTDPEYLFRQHSLRRLGHSWKTSYFGTARLTTKCSTTAPGGGTTTTESSKEVILQEEYRRVAGFPAYTSETGYFSGLSKTQLASGAALIVQRM